ncbi:alpha-ketoglutarate-dependent dioxygenase AlkB [Stenotrophomonas koreensis]|uniref:alpha-ketoglutarate-dependent dioxygenase AlkB family protein n=1 Tax=Stenotrophomonas koreensis TaxID=266128 RepID=UPI003397A18E
MNHDLFAPAQSFQRLPLPDAEVLLLRQLALPGSAEDLLQQLIEQIAWRQEQIELWGKRYLQPRLIAWHGDAGRSYRYSGLALEPQPWTLLQALRHAVETACGEVFNSVLLNHYRNGRDSMGMHSDDEPELGEQPVIASLSLGEPRNLIFRHKRISTLAPVQVPLPSGSLLLMKGDTQRYWKHGIAKSSRPLGPRVNLTFRQIL